eukprot:gene17689-20149_t
MGSMRTKPMHRSESGSSGTGSGKGLGRKLFNANGPSKVVPVDEELENIEEEDHDHQMSMSYHMPERTTFKSFRAVPDTDRFNSLLATTSSTTNLGQEEFTAKLHPLGGASNV